MTLSVNLVVIDAVVMSLCKQNGHHGYKKVAYHCQHETLKPVRVHQPWRWNYRCRNSIRNFSHHLHIN